ncbi:hypothetical protein RQP46_007349 [Phenoliferia psychrophenolica]
MAPRATLDSTFAVKTPVATKQALSKLSKASLCLLALAWLADAPPTSPNRQRKRRRLDRDSEASSSASSSESEDDEEDGGGKDEYERMRDDARVGKPRVIQAILNHWSGGLTYRQVAQIDVQLLKDKPTSRSWTAFQLKHTQASPAYTTPAQLSTRLRAALAPYHNHHLHTDSTPTLTTLRLQLVPSSPLSPTPPPILLLHLPQTPFLLLPSLPSTLAPILLQCLCAALSTPPAREASELQLKGKDWRGLRDLLRGKMSSGGMQEWREGKGEGGGPLVTQARRLASEEETQLRASKDLTSTSLQPDDPHLSLSRTHESTTVFGRSSLPVLDRLDYEQISLPYFNSTVPAPEPFLVRFEGTHVLEGLRTAVEGGFADGGLPKWIGSVAREGRNAIRVGEDVEG